MSTSSCIQYIHALKVLKTSRALPKELLDQQSATSTITLASLPYDIQNFIFELALAGPKASIEVEGPKLFTKPPNLLACKPIRSEPTGPYDTYRNVTADLDLTQTDTSTSTFLEAIILLARELARPGLPQINLTLTLRYSYNTRLSALAIVPYLKSNEMFGSLPMRVQGECLEVEKSEEGERKLSALLDLRRVWAESGTETFEAYRRRLWAGVIEQWDGHVAWDLLKDVFVCWRHHAGDRDLHNFKRFKQMEKMGMLRSDQWSGS